MDLESSIIAVLVEKKVKVETIIEKCHRVDKNRDGIIHVNDFVKAINQLLGIYTLTKQQMSYIISNIVCEHNHNLVEFEKLETLIDTRNHVELQPEENWYTEELDSDLRHSGRHDLPLVQGTRDTSRDTRIARRHSTDSVGQWIQEYACESEIE